MPSYFLAKSEPAVYAFARLVKDKKTVWDGVRNFEARNNLRQMKKGDLVLFYHSGEDKAVVGIAKVLREAYPDPTSKEGDWSAVDLAPVKALTEHVTLAHMKADPAFEGLSLLKKSRLSVLPVSPTHFERILKLGKTKAQ
jgi:predicted RNA-binding protein with PUA-like domain